MITAMRLSLGIVGIYFLIAAGVFVAGEWLYYQDPIGDVHVPPTLDQGVWMIGGTDALGRSVAKKLLIAIESSFAFGLVVAIGSVVLGAAFGVVSGFFGGWVDIVVTWLFTTLSAVPGILVLLAIMFVFGSGFWTAVAALVFLDWVGLCRMLRGEVMKEKTKDYVLAATAVGGGKMRVMLRHVLPNVSHYLWIYFALYFIFAVKAEIILAFLGFQFTEGVSWGIIIGEARGELLKGVWWPITGATITMAGLLLSLQICADSLRDRFDPRMRTSV